MKQKQEKWVKKHPVWTIVMAICAIIIILCIAIPGGPSEPQLNEFGEDYKVDDTAACVMAEIFVEKQLKSPGSAVFQYCGDQTINYLGDQTYYVRGYVDAQNSFGALIRVKYVVQIVDNQDETWHLNDIHVWE